MKKLVLAATAAISLASCYKATIHLKPAQGAAPSPTVEDEMHFSLINIIEISDPVDMKAACAVSEPVQIKERLTFLGGIVNAVLGTYVPVLSVMNPTVMCSTTPTAQ